MRNDERRPGAARLAWRVLLTPEQLPETLGVFLREAEICWHPPHPQAGAAPSGDGSPLRLPDPAGGILTARRHHGGFTRCERAGAKVFTWLARRPAWTRTRRRRVTLPAGATVTLRRAGAADLRAVTALHALCAPPTGPGAAGLPTRKALPRLLSPRVGTSVLAEAPGRRPVAWASLSCDGPDADAVLLVADAWRHRGLCTVLLQELHRAARTAGARTLWIHAADDDPAVKRAAAELRLAVAAGDDGGPTGLSTSLSPAPVVWPRKAPVRGDHDRRAKTYTAFLMRKSGPSGRP
ncbi:GNAT family N-acetyltransferase [Streptomyces sp. NPDC051173]|uniref:GNAT family N-acetyltransferase n=1 Tax=Streptomyces sp. NPDC051173 TaxID=3155164 RepID=UPI00344FF413